MVHDVTIFPLDAFAPVYGKEPLAMKEHISDSVAALQSPEHDDEGFIHEPFILVPPGQSYTHPVPLAL